MEETMDVGSVVESVATDDENAPLYKVESLCMRCHQNGTSSFLLTLIPHFRKILLSAFECPHCGERNNQVQFAGEIQPRGSRYLVEFPSGDQKMLNRQVVKSETATIKIPQLDFEIPPESQCGSLSTVEGILLRASEGLQALQEERKKVDPQTAEAIDYFVENPFAPSPDPSLHIEFYERTPEQQASLGYVFDPTQSTEVSSEAVSSSQGTVEPHGSVGAVAGRRAIAQGNTVEFSEALFRYSAPEEVMTFPTTCGACAVSCETRMYVTNIPYFREVIVMASTCDGCGYRNSELKAGGAIPDKGKKVSVSVKNNRDLNRDIIKSDTASVIIPEIDLELTSGTLGGLVSTVEGLVTKISEAFIKGCLFQTCKAESDGKENCENLKNKWQDFRARLIKLLSLEEPWTLILDDALANSYIAPACDDIKDDHQLSIEEYERSWEQNEELGLNDMDTSADDGAYNSVEAS
uniref:Zinc finger protein ZPR1-like n=1 Tax=Tanacetum cinerariifolium TaxID=118510 RepID=A0A6L2LDC8_TANCI|nr:zinc finger protein ZPR1-like [Tanacetum cinerariifolium]